MISLAEIQDNGWQSSLGNFLLFLKRVAAASAIQKHLTSRKWISRILAMTGQFDESGNKQTVITFSGSLSYIHLCFKYNHNAICQIKKLE